MTYHRKNGNNTILVARRGYGDLGAADAAENYCNPITHTMDQFAQCTAAFRAGTVMPASSFPPASASGGGSPGTLAQIGGGIKDILGGALSAFAAAKGGAGAQPVVVGGGTPSWLLPVALGGVGLVAILMLRPKRSAPTSNPRRRRRRRRNPRFRRMHRRRRR